MPRYRTVKPEFWSSEQVMECSPNARLAFIGMWNFCDDAGRHRASLKTLKAEVFPSDPITCDEIGKWIFELVTNGLLDEYEVDGERYWQVTGWKHQKIDQPTYRFPGPDGTVERSPNRRRTNAECSEANGTERNGEERSGVEVNRKEKSLKTGTAGVFSCVTKKILSDDSALLAWIDNAQSLDPPAIEDCEATPLRIFAAAEMALSGRNPAAFFVDTVKRRQWTWMTQEQEQRAAARLKRLGRGPPSKFAIEYTANIGKSPPPIV